MKDNDNINEKNLDIEDTSTDNETEQRVSLFDRLRQKLSKANNKGINIDESPEDIQKDTVENNQESELKSTDQVEEIEFEQELEEQKVSKISQLKKWCSSKFHRLDTNPILHLQSKLKKGLDLGEIKTYDEHNDIIHLEEQTDDIFDEEGIVAYFEENADIDSNSEREVKKTKPHVRTQEEQMRLLFICLVLISGLAVILAEIILNMSLNKRYKEIADDHRILVDNTSDIEEETTEEIPQDLGLQSIEMLDSDQIARQVGSYIDVLEIPNYDVLCYIYPDTDEESLIYGVGHYKSSKQIGELGVCAVAGHSSDTYNCIMNKARNIKTMEEFYVYDDNGDKHTYYVTGVYVVDPYATEELQTKEKDKEHSVFKIITCTNAGLDRLIIEGTELSSTEVAEYKRTHKLIKENEIYAMIDTQLEGLDILGKYYESTSGKLKGYWYYVRQNSNYGIVSQTNREILQNLTKIKKVEESDYDIPEI